MLQVPARELGAVDVNPIESHFLTPYFAEPLRGIAHSSQLSIAEALRIVRSSHDAVGRFCDEYEAAVSRSRARMVSQFPTACTSPMTCETHHGGECIYRANGEHCSPVLYSSRRAHPHAFTAAVKFVCHQLGVRLHVREPAQTSRGVAVRAYHPASKIVETGKASFASGIVLTCAQVLGLTDAHADNVTFHDDCPVVLDDECVMQPLRSTQLAILETDAEESLYGFSRTLLLPGPTIGPKTCGFSQLLSSGVDQGAFESGYLLAANTILERRTKFLECIETAASAHPWARYLVRSTEFYTLCKRVVGTTILTRATQTAELTGALSSCFAYESNAYPELAVFTPHESKLLARGDTPYYLIHLRKGQIQSDRDSESLLRIDVPFCWFEERLPRCLSRIVSIGKSDLDTALKLSNQTLNPSENGGRDLA